MELKVVWTRRASKNYLKILRYIISEFEKNAGWEYQDRVESLIGLLTQFPDLGTSQVQGENLKAIVLYRRTTIFYSVNHANLKIINVVDNRWDR